MIAAGFRVAMLAFALTAHPAASRAGESVHRLRPVDPQGVFVAPGEGGALGDGVADDTAALQAAIDHVQATTRRGVVFLGAGRYRLTRALLVWSGIRLIGYGPARPVLCLGPETPGYQTGEGRYLVHFVSEKPESPDQPVRDANPGTFYSAMANIDIEIGDGNPAAIGVRSHYAQHGFLAHMDFRIGQGRAGVEEVGNESSFLRFFGGEFGITTHKPSPSWPFVLLDSEFEGQRQAAIETEEGGLTLVRLSIRRTPTVVQVRPDRCEELYVEDSRFEEISGPAIVISDETSARTQINLRHVACIRVPVLAQFRESGRTVAGPAPAYVVHDFCHGLQYADLGADPSVRTTADLRPVATLPAPVASDVPALPPMEMWTDVRALGVRGDGVTDDTAALRAALAAHPVLYFPAGRYVVTDTLTLRPDGVLIGFNPITTQLILPDGTPGFQSPDAPAGPAEARATFWGVPPPFPGKGSPKALLEAPPGGRNIVTGLGLDTGALNNRAVALKWMAGEQSLVNDVRFLGGHGTYGPDGHYLRIYNDTRTGDPDPRRRWDSQPASLWVTAGGGGTFKGLWSPSPYASAGLHVSDTSTPGRVYALSSEHHVRTEVKLRNVAHWRFYALQTEAERGESPLMLPLEIEGCRDLLVANFFIYRVDLPVPFFTGIRVANSRNLQFRGLHVYSPGKLSYDNTLVDVTRGIEVRSREIARLDVSDRAAPVKAARSSLLWAEGAGPQKVAGGFVHADGLVAGSTGEVYFFDQAAHRIHRWSEAEGLTLVTDAIPEPVGLVPDRSGGLMVLSRHGSVYAIPPAAGDESIAILKPQPARARPEACVWLPVSRWRDSHDWLEASTRAEPWHYVSPDGSVLVPVPDEYVKLPARSGRASGTIDVTRTYALAPALAGRPFFGADEFGQTTWRFTPDEHGRLTQPELFAEEGEAGTTVDQDGRVYVCAGQVYVYAPDGRLLGVIEVPERPSAVAIAGRKGQTLMIAARSSLYRLPLDHLPVP